MAKLAIAPKVTANRVAHPAFSIEFRIASVGSTPSRMPGRTSVAPRSRHAASDHPDGVENDCATNASSGAAQTQQVSAPIVATRRRSRPGRGERRAPGSSSIDRLYRRCDHDDQPMAVARITSWRIDSVAAAPMLPSCVACLQTSTSRVRVPAVPSTRTTPNEVNVKANTIDAAAVRAGRSSGSVMARNTVQSDAPSAAAANSMSAGSCSQKGPTVRTTTARLNTTCAARTAPTLRSSPSGSKARNAAPITTVGRTKIAVSMPSRS